MPANAQLRATDCVKELIHCETSPLTPNLHVYTCRVSSERIPPSCQSLLKCGGASTQPKAAKQAALGEAIERYSAIEFALNAPHFYGSAKELTASDAAILDSAGRFGDWHNQGSRFDEFGADSSCRWYVGTDLHSGTATALPGPFACLPYVRRSGEQPFSASTSTGLAFQVSSGLATMYGLFECIERDAVALAWNWGLPAIDVSCHHIVKHCAKEIGLPNYIQVKAFDITTDLGIPVAMAFLFDNTPPHHSFLAVGSASRSTLAEAIAKAITEAAHGITYISFLTREGGISCCKSTPKEISSFEDSAIFYTNNPHFLGFVLRERGDFLRTTERFRSSIDVRCIGDILRTLESGNKRAFEVDMTSPLARKAGGFVKRAFLPDLYSLEGGYLDRCQKSTRAEAVASALGLDLRADGFPHPLP